MKRLLSAAVLVFGFVSTVYAANIYWFCAAAIRVPSEKIVRMFNATHKDKVVFISGGTGQVLQQMIMAKKGDIYTPLDQKFFELAKSKGLVLKAVRFLKLTPVFALARGSENRIKNFSDLLKPGIRIAAGNPKTMALGKTYAYILAHMPKDMRRKLKRNVVVEAINISQIVNYLKLGNVDAGIVFDAVANMNHFRYVSIPAKYNQVKSGYIVEMSFPSSRQLKDELFNYILKHLDVYKKYGFVVVRQK